MRNPKMAGVRVREGRLYGVWGCEVEGRGMRKGELVWTPLLRAWFWAWGEIRVS